MIKFKNFSMVICMLSIIAMPITLFVNFKLCAVTMVIFLISWTCTQIARIAIKEKITNDRYNQIQK